MVCPDRRPAARIFPFGITSAYKVHLRVLKRMGIAPLVSPGAIRPKGNYFNIRNFVS